MSMPPEYYKEMNPVGRAALPERMKVRALKLIPCYEPVMFSSGTASYHPRIVVIIPENS